MNLVEKEVERLMRIKGAKRSRLSDECFLCGKNTTYSLNYYKPKFKQLTIPLCPYCIETKLRDIKEAWAEKKAKKK